jgi:hypothetical protein
LFEDSFLDGQSGFGLLESGFGIGFSGGNISSGFGDFG